MSEDSEKETKHLQWIYDRLMHVHKENPNVDYMHRLKEIIESHEARDKLGKRFIKAFLK